MRIILYPYKIYSESAKALQNYLKEQGLRCIRVFPSGRYRPRRNDIVINWGNSRYGRWDRANANGVRPYFYRVFNEPACVSVASNKLSTLEILKQNSISVPEFTSSYADAVDWMESEVIFLERHSLTGHSGAGIRVIKGEEILAEAPLYVQYIKKKDEYRVHVFKGQVVDVQKKRKRDGWRDNENYSSEIRNLSTGWVFTREDVVEPEGLRELAIASVQALGLDFGAVDIIHNTKKGLFVLEVNTAPGLEGQTVEKYGQAIINYIRENM